MFIVWTTEIAVSDVCVGSRVVIEIITDGGVGNKSVNFSYKFVILKTPICFCANTNLFL